MINDLLKEKSITKYRLSKLSGIPYTTINDVCSGKADIKRCSADTVYRIAGALDVSMETLLKPYYVDRPDFELFKSNICHRLKELGDIDFILEILENDTISEYYDRGWYPEALYLLAMLDYVSRENDVPLCDRYDDIRGEKLSRVLYPRSVLACSIASGTDDVRAKARQNAISEFMRHNIVESEVRNVI